MTRPSAPPVLTEMNDRTREVFRLVVESFLEHGQPVASRTLSRFSDLNLSPASIRNVMQDLEEIGLLAAPHTSAGRQPTELGLRLFVDGIMQVAEPSAADRAHIEQSLTEAGPVEQALAKATAVLSGLSACAGLVLVPPQERILRQLSFVPLGPLQALVVLVGQDGAVENRVMDLPHGVTASQLTEAGNFLTAHYAGQSLSDALGALASDIARQQAALDRAVADLVTRGLAHLGEDASRRPVLIVRGQAHLLDAGSAQDIDRVRMLLGELETKEDIARLLGNAGQGTATRIFIGSENQLFSLSGSSVIAAPCRGQDGRVIGVVGVIGPTRLNYARIVPMVDFTAQTISRLIQ